MWIWSLFFFLPSVQAKAEFWLSAPETHTLFSGGIEVSYHIPSNSPKLQLQLIQIGKDKIIAKRDVPQKILKGRIVFACDTFQRAGQFAFKLVTFQDEEKILTWSRFINVQWPEVTVHVPLMVETYSSDVLIQLYVGKLQCRRHGSYRTYIDLVYEGPAATTWQKSSVLTTKLLEKWFWNPSYDVILDCELFDRAGNYTVHVRTDISDAPVIAASETILVMWSHRYSVSVARSSVQPCDGSLSVIYHYPRCILDQDRIRVYGKGVKGPLKYIRESKIETGKHSTKLSCDIFEDQEYEEYCFSFVSTARNGAVFDLTTHCVPTVIENKNYISLWGEWSPWSTCSASCGNGIKSRYRLCISQTNTTDCAGRAVQSQACSSKPCLANIDTTTEEPVAWDCSCGCERNITDELLIKLSVSECDYEEVSWILQAWPDGHIIIEIKDSVFPCRNCWLTIRDGKSPLDMVLAIIDSFTTVPTVHSHSNNMRLEIHVGNSSTQDVELTCIVKRSENPRKNLAMLRQNPEVEESRSLSAVHLTFIMLAILLCVSIIFMLFLQVYRKYKCRTLNHISQNMYASDIQTSTSELSLKTPSASPEDYLYKSFIFRSPTSTHPKLKWGKLPSKLEPSETSSPVRRRGRLAAKNVQRESTAPLAASVSELSTIGSDDGLEYDYYDYACHQEPGSFFCPDPVLIGWPPFIPLPPQNIEEIGDYPLQHFTPSPEHS